MWKVNFLLKKKLIFFQQLQFFFATTIVTVEYLKRKIQIHNHAL